MAKTIIGRNLPLYKGEYSTATVYDRFDVVLYDGSSYVSKLPNNQNKPVSNTTYWQLLAQRGEFTEQQLEDFKAAVVAESKSEMDDYTDDKKAELDTYEGTKETELDTYANGLKDDFDTNATSKTTIFNNNAATKITEFDTNASTKTTAFNDNATSKTNAFNTNATNKTTDFNDNATAKTTAFDTNATNKTDDFDDNASDKTDDFNDNATSKTTEFDEHVEEKTEEFDENVESLQQEIDELSENMPWNETEQATEIQVTDAAKYSRNRLKLFGNTEQASYSGKNLFDKNAENTENAYINTTNSTIVSNANARSLYIPIKPNTTYTISRKAGQRFAVISATDYAIGTVGTNIVYNHTESSLTITTGASDTYLVVFYYLSTADTLTEEEIRNGIQIEEGQTATSYEPYVGGIASPNPNYPQDIHVVTGNNTITVQGKNLWGGFTYSRTSAGVVHTYNEDGSITVKGTATANSTSINISDAVSNNVYETLQAGTYIVSGGGEDYTINIYDTNSNLLANVSKGTASNSFTITETTNVVLRAQVSNGTQIDAVIKLQLEKGSTSTSYEPYVTPQNYSINLGSIELCKIGDYQDYLYKENGNWYKYNAVGKLVLDGSEKKWVKASTTEVDRFAINTSDYSANVNSKCNYFTRGGISDYSVGKFNNNASVQLLFNFSKYGTTTLEQWKTWVSTHNLILYQPLTIPTTTQITDPILIAQLDAIYEHFKLTKGINNITVTAEDLAPNMELEYMQDLPSKLENLASRLELLEE